MVVLGSGLPSAWQEHILPEGLCGRGGPLGGLPGWLGWSPELLCAQLPHRRPACPAAWRSQHTRQVGVGVWRVRPHGTTQPNMRHRRHSAGLEGCAACSLPGCSAVEECIVCSLRQVGSVEAESPPRTSEVGYRAISADSGKSQPASSDSLYPVLAVEGPQVRTHARGTAALQKTFAPFLPSPCITGRCSDHSACKSPVLPPKNLHHSPGPPCGATELQGLLLSSARLECVLVIPSDLSAKR